MTKGWNCSLAGLKPRTTGCDLGPIDSLLAENAKAIELAEGAVQASQKALEAAAIEEARSRIAELPQKRSEYTSALAAAENQAAGHIELALRFFRELGDSEVCDRLKTVLDEDRPLGVFEDIRRPLRESGRAFADDFLSKHGAIPELSRMRSEAVMLDSASNHGVMSASSHIVQKIWKAARREAEAAAGLNQKRRKTVPTTSWRAT